MNNILRFAADSLFETNYTRYECEVLEKPITHGGFRFYPLEESPCKEEAWCHEPLPHSRENARWSYSYLGQPKSKSFLKGRAEPLQG